MIHKVPKKGKLQQIECDNSMPVLLALGQSLQLAPE